MAIVASSFALRSISACVTRAHTASSHVRSDSKVDEDDDDEDDEAAIRVCAADANARARRSLPPTPSLFAKDDDEECDDEDEPASTRA